MHHEHFHPHISKALASVCVGAFEAAHVADAGRRLLCKRTRKIIAETQELLAGLRLDAAVAAWRIWR
jgi:hypothetical protein